MSEPGGIAGAATPDWRGYAEELDAIEDDLAKAQEAKRDIYKNVREIHGKVKADALKAAMRIRGMKPEKRDQAEQIEAETSLILDAINRPRVTRGAPRAREANKIGAGRNPGAEPLAEQRPNTSSAPIPPSDPTAPPNPSAVGPKRVAASAPEKTPRHLQISPKTGLAQGEPVPDFLRRA